jgi:predicted metal-binding membrane protein
MPSRARSVSWPDGILIGLLGAMVLMAWYVLWLGAHSAYGHALFHSHLQMTPAMAHSPSLLAFIFVAGWTLMTVAMMLPTSVPLILMFHRMVRGRKSASWLVAAVILGYVAIWAFCGVLLQFANQVLQMGLGRLAGIAAAPSIGAVVLLTAAGLYQFSSLKHACLDKCRSPLSFLTSRWHGGNETAQALRIGAEHGLYCVGCCWSLMALMFIVGAGSLAWMLLLGVVMALEKNLPIGRRFSAPLGWVLLTAAAVVVVEAVR